jgi:hypothetical protein
MMRVNVSKKAVTDMNPSDREIPDDELIQLFSGKIAYQGAVAYYLDENLSLVIVGLLQEKDIRVTTVYIED